MSGFTNIVKKELRELLTRSTVIPVVLMAVMFGLLGNAFSGIEEQISAPPKLGIVNMDDGVLAQIAVSQIANLSEVQYNGTNVNLALDTVDHNGGMAVLVIPANFTQQVMDGNRGSVEIYWIMRGAGLTDSVSSTTVETVLSTASLSISAYLVEHNSSANASIVLSPTSHTDTTIFRSKEMVGISPTELSSVMSSQSTIVPIVIMMIVMMAGSQIVTSMVVDAANVFWVILGSGFGDMAFFFPGALTLTVMFSAVFSTMSLIEDRREGFLLSMLVSPAPRGSMVLGKTLGSATLAWLQGLIFMAFGPLTGVWLPVVTLLQAVGVVFLISLTFTLMGFLIAWHMESSQGFHAVMNLVLFPLWMISGSLFTPEKAHGWIRLVMKVNPLAYAQSALQHLLDPRGAAGMPGMGLSLTVTALCAAALLVASTIAANRKRRVSSA